MLRQWRTRATAPERVRPRPEVGDLAEVFERCALLLDWISFGVVHPADDVHALGLQLDACPLPWLSTSTPVAMTAHPEVSFLISLS